jgi:histidine ammonia-lyase
VIAPPHPIDGRTYTLDDLERLVVDRVPLELAPDTLAAIDRGSDYLASKLDQDLHIYGVNTGLGALCETRLAGPEIDQLQRNLLISHACGVGDTVSEDLSRTMLIIKLLTFRSGHTAITSTTGQRLVDMWNAGVVPAVPKRGTVGASGDLAPLAHLALPLIGLGDVWVDGRIEDAAEVNARHGWAPLTLQPKEGLALVNGVQYIDAMAVQQLNELRRLVRAADLVAALSVQAFSVSQSFCHERYHRTSFHPERAVCAANLRSLLRDGNHHTLPNANKSQQDPYSFRCIPQVHGAVRQALGFAVTVIEQEINGVSDNPLFFPDEDLILYGGNLHGASTAMVLDFLAIATTELGSISERRSYQLLSGSRGLPDFLVGNAGVNSGFMVSQYTAAALVNENKVLSTPASVDTIPTCQLQEDSVSMGGTSGYKLEQVVDNCTTILAIELLLAMQGTELNPGLVLSPATLGLREKFREQVAFLDGDRLLSADIAASRAFLTTRGYEHSHDLG